MAKEKSKPLTIVLSVEVVEVVRFRYHSGSFTIHSAETGTGPRKMGKRTKDDKGRIATKTGAILYAGLNEHQEASTMLRQRLPSKPKKPTSLPNEVRSLSSHLIFLVYYFN